MKTASPCACMYTVINVNIVNTADYLVMKYTNCLDCIHLYVILHG